MSRDYRLSEYNPFLNMHDLQPPPPRPPLYPAYPVQQNMHPMNDPRAPPPFEMTAAAPAGAACAEGVPPAAAPLHPLDPRKRKNSLFEYEMNDVQFSGSERSAAAGTTGSGRRKRKSSFGSASFEDDCCDDSRSSRTTSTLPDKKQNHSEIEKRRRDKMNTYITELSSMIPMCGAMARKLDKLTVLRMAVAHLRLVRGAQTAGPLAAPPRPAFLEERDLNALLLHAAADCFLLVVGCARGRLLYVSQSVADMLHYTQAELLGQSMFDILHPKDVAKVKEQLSSSDLSPRERFIDAKTMLPVKSDVVAGVQRLCPGARRSFFCRIKCKTTAEPAPPPPPPPAPPEPTPHDASVKEDPDNNTKHRKKNEKKYCVVQCTGYLKSWAPAEMEGCGGGGAETDGEDQCTLSCLVAVGRALPDLAPPSAPASAPAPAPATRPLQYVSRHAIDGKFLFVDQRVTLALGFLPQELLGTSLYEYVGPRELGGVARAHKTALVHRAPMRTPPYAFRRKDGSSATIHTHFKPFRNPWTKDVECLVANNSIVPETAADDAHLNYDVFKHTDEWRDFATCVASCAPAPPPPPPPPPAPPPQHLGGAGGAAGGAGGAGGGGGDAEVQRLIDSQVESHKIGSAIAEEVCRRPPSGFSPPALLLQDPLFNPSSLVDNILGVELSSFSGRGEGAEGGGEGGGEGGASPPLPPLGLDGNGEAAMAVIMSLLEADAGLGGPVNFSGLPWPLP